MKLQGREVRLQVFLRHGPFLSWSGFEAMCNDFKIAAVTPTALPQAHAVLVPASSSSQQLEPPTPSPTVQEDLRYWTPAEGYLLNAAQARIAFVSACTNRSMVASFPEGTTNMSPAIVGSRSKGETTHAEEKNYWRVGCWRNNYGGGGGAQVLGSCATKRVLQPVLSIFSAPAIEMAARSDIAPG